MVERGLKDRAAALRAELTLLDRQEDLLARIATLETYGFSVFAAQVARATLQSIVGSPAQAEKLMSNALSWKVTGSSGHWIE